MVEFLGISAGIAVGLGFLAIAIFERGIRTYLEKKKVDPTVKFDGSYFLNIMITAGGGSGIMAILSILPSLLTALTEQESTIVTLATLASQALTGYTVGYTMLDKLNSSVETKYALSETKASTPAPVA